MNCHYCDHPATKLCDHVVAIAADPSWSSECVTCDRPLCDEHAAHKGVMFTDYYEETDQLQGYVDTIDKCPGHKSVPDDLTLPIVSRADAEAMKVRLHKKG